MQHSPTYVKMFLHFTSLRPRASRRPLSAGSPSPMKATSVLAGCLVIASSGLPPVYAADLPPRLPRADSFLGIHFDFHARADSTEVGHGWTARPRVAQLPHVIYQ